MENNKKEEKKSKPKTLKQKNSDLKNVTTEFDVEKIHSNHKKTLIRDVINSLETSHLGNIIYSSESESFYIWDKRWIQDGQMMYMIIENCATALLPDFRITVDYEFCNCIARLIRHV